MSGYEWVCPTSVERRVQYLLKVLMDSKSSKKKKEDTQEGWTKEECGL